MKEPLSPLTPQELAQQTGDQPEAQAPSESTDLMAKPDPTATDESKNPFVGDHAVPDVWTLFFRDAADDPIIGLHGWIHVDGKEIPFVTGEMGEAPGLPRSSSPIPIEVKKVDGGRKTVGEADLLPQTSGVAVTSPKTKHRGETKVHEVQAPVNDGPRLSEQGDWIREAMQAHLKTSGMDYSHQSHSELWQEKCRWVPPLQLEKFMKRSVEPPKKEVGKMSMQVLGQGKTIQTRDDSGHPVTLVGVEAWDGQLALGVNEKWRPALEEAMAIPSVSQTGIKIYALAALINSEAGSRTGYNVIKEPVMGKDHKQRKDPKSSDGLMYRERRVQVDLGWNETAHNPDKESDAAGLTQFIRSTWELMAKNQSTHLGKYAREKGWITRKEILANEYFGKGAGLYDPDLQKRLDRLAQARKIYQDAHELQPHESSPHGKHNKQTLQPPKTTMRYFMENKSDHDELMKLREDGRMSILTAAEGFSLNFANFRENGFNTNNIVNPFEVAKLAYYLHFLGPGDGKKLGLWKMEESRAEYLLRHQFVNNPSGLEELIESSGNDKWVERLWFFTERLCGNRLTNGFIKYCNPTPTPTQIGRAIRDILKGISL